MPDVYHQYKTCGSATIELPDDDPFTWDDVDPETTDLLSTVWNTYGGFSAGRLRSMTHQEAPWKTHFRPEERGIVIPQHEIERYFADRKSRL